MAPVVIIYDRKTLIVQQIYKFSDVGNTENIVVPKGSLRIIIDTSVYSQFKTHDDIQAFVRNYHGNP